MDEPLASSLEEKRMALVSQCMEAARMAMALASVNYELAVIHRAPRDEAESFLDMVGKFSHERMEILANILNGMDAVEHADAERSKPIFERARRLFPITATSSSAAQSASGSTP